jgi:periplasmic protein TonB
MSLSAHPSDRLERSYYRRVEAAFVLALGIHAAALLLAPPYVARPYHLDAAPLRLVAAASFGTSVAADVGGAAPSGPEAPPPRATAFARVATPIVTEQLQPSRQAQDSPAAPRGTSQGYPGGAPLEGADDGPPPVFYAFDSPPQVLEAVTPEYPAAAKAQESEGLVVLNANVDERGRVIRVWVARSTASEILVTSAIDALYRYRFKPGSEQGVPVTCTVAVPFNFRLNIHL